MRIASKGVLHFLPKMCMFCALFQNNQPIFEKQHASYRKMLKELKNGTDILVGQAVFKGALHY